MVDVVAYAYERVQLHSAELQLFHEDLEQVVEVFGFNGLVGGDLAFQVMVDAEDVLVV